MYDLRFMRHFEAVYRHLSFSAAAEELGLTHSAITKSIKTLEADWATQLFHRTTRTVVATEAGKKLYPQALELLAFAANVRETTTSGGHELNIVSGPGVIEGMIHPAIIKFARTFPKTRINVSTMPPHLAAEELIQRRIHLLIYHQASLSGLPHKQRMRVTEVIDEPYWMIYRKGHPVGQCRSDLGDVLRYQWAIAGFDQLFERSLPEDLRQLLLDHGAPHYRLLSQAACIELAKQSDILTTLPETAARNAIAEGTIEGQPHPGGFRFTIGAAVLYDASREQTVEHFVECL
ncbi:MAG: LysR family transcriptional regulator [Altererythrobacter sp.]|jgi:LysR family transcriptional regulator of abg operon|nr:LysR family transcriptional regulator [Altererythrobacter sp.]